MHSNDNYATQTTHNVWQHMQQRQKQITALDDYSSQKQYVYVSNHISTVYSGQISSRVSNMSVDVDKKRKLVTV